MSSTILIVGEKNYKPRNMNNLSKYHQKYANQSDEEIRKRAAEKEKELIAVFEKIQLKSNNIPVRVAVLGCGDKRFIAHHKRIFQKLLNKSVELTTFDISIEHLSGEEGIIQHDCTNSLPNPPYDITFAHVLLKFIETEKQWNLIKNSYDALSRGGLAIHVLDKQDYTTADLRLPDGYYSVPLERYKKRLLDEDIKFIEIPVKYGLMFVLYKKADKQ